MKISFREIEKNNRESCINKQYNTSTPSKINLKFSEKTILYNIMHKFKRSN